MGAFSALCAVVLMKEARLLFCINYVISFSTRERGRS